MSSHATRQGHACPRSPQLPEPLLNDSGLQCLRTHLHFKETKRRKKKKKTLKEMRERGMSYRAFSSKPPQIRKKLLPSKDYRRRTSQGTKLCTTAHTTIVCSLKIPVPPVFFSFFFLPYAYQRGYRNTKLPQENSEATRMMVMTASKEEVILDI